MNLGFLPKLKTVPEQFLMLLCSEWGMAVNVWMKRKHFLPGENASASGKSTQEEM